MWRKLFFFEWILILSFFFVSFTIIKTCYNKGKSSGLSLQIVEKKYIDSYSRYIFVSSNGAMVDVTEKTYKETYIGEKYKDYWYQ